MTVCLVGITKDKHLIAIADKKYTVTAGLTSVYEISENRKIIQLTDNCAAMFAGNVENANEILTKAKPKIKATDDLEAIARKIIQVNNEAYNSAVEAQLLAKYKLDFDSFNKQQKTLDATFVSTTIQTIGQNNLGVQILLIGTDNGVPRILKINENNGLSDETSIGYAAIGSGSSHASLSLMESELHSNLDFDAVLIALVRAKRRAEYDANVGEKSDIVVIDKDVKFIEEEKVKMAFQEYDSCLEEVKSVHSKGSKKIGGIVNGASTK